LRRLFCRRRRLNAPPPTRRLAVYLSSHGLGHAVRAAAVLDQLLGLTPLELTVIGPCERRIWPPALAGVTTNWVPEACDVGVVQANDVTVDLAETGRRLDAWLDGLESLLHRESARLAGRFDLVLGDVPAAAFEAATSEGIPSVAIANFSWDWIYSELGFREAAAASAKRYASAGLLLEATPFAPMPAFAKRVNVGLIARKPSSRRAETRAALGVADGEALVLVAFQPVSAPDLALPRVRTGLRFLVPAGWPGGSLRGDVLRLPADVPFEDALAAADVVLGKPGYGLIGDVEAAGVRFLYVPRPGFPENEILERYLRRRPATASLAATRLSAGEWEDDLEAILGSSRPAPADAKGAARAATEIARVLGIDTDPDTD
jgi:hypothetical protein